MVQLPHPCGPTHSNQVARPTRSLETIIQYIRCNGNKCNITKEKTLVDNLSQILHFIRAASPEYIYEIFVLFTLLG